ncbi:MAG: succinylglutamate desuccinylase/aspartoacylase family protein [Candidatus Uhrbacteria bacterium]|nr:succinylglutamate desuccinylase/aspartoacylase family protein [Candidatus Uhrbacteria bacterium]
MIEAISESIAKVVGEQKGPTVVLLGGIHGNERTGVEVVKKLAYQFEHGEKKLASGVLYLILGNPKAIERNTRGSEDHADLNRCFKYDVLERVPETYEQTRAHEIAKILATADISIDLHATNKPSVPFLCCAVDEAHEKIYQWFDCDRVLADPRYILGGESVTTDEFIDLQGGVGICYETGQSTDLTRVDEVLGDVMNVFIDQGMIDGFVPTRNTIGRSIYELMSVINLTDAGFRYEGTLGGGSFEEFTIGQTIGYVGDEPVVAEFDGVIVFPKIPELQTLGKPVVYLAKKIK